jgi:hypothetical protein
LGEKVIFYHSEKGLEFEKTVLLEFENLKSKHCQKTGFLKDITDAISRLDRIECGDRLAGPWQLAFFLAAGAGGDFGAHPHHHRQRDDLPAPTFSPPRVGFASSGVAFFPFLALADYGTGDQRMDCHSPQAPRQM